MKYFVICVCLFLYLFVCLLCIVCVFFVYCFEVQIVEMA
jgi:hypothetical protein